MIRYLSTAALYGAGLATLSAVLIRRGRGFEAEKRRGYVLAAAVLPVTVAACAFEVRRGATYLHPRGDAVGTALAAAALVVGRVR